MKPKPTNQHALTHRSLDKFNSDQLRTELGNNNRQMNILQDLNEAILKRLQERGLSPIDAPERGLKPKGQVTHVWMDEAESMMDLDLGQTPPSRDFTLQRVSFPEPIVVLADQTLELVMQGGSVVGVDITPTKVATPLSAEELRAGGWWLDEVGGQSLQALFREYSVSTTRVSSHWFGSSVGDTCVISSSDYGSNLGGFKQIHHNGDFFYLGKAPK